MARVANPRKVFNFMIEVDGIDQFAVQVATPPTVGIEAVEHGDTNHTIKTAGRLTVGDFTVQKLKPLPSSDVWAWRWLKRAQDFKKGGGELPINYKKTIVIRELSTDNSTTANRWILEGCWVKEVSQTDFDRMSSDNVIETVVFSVDTVDQM